MFLKNEKVMRWVTIIFGLVLVVFGMNGFFRFLPAVVFNEAGTSFLGALFSVGYIFPIMNVLWILFGLLFLFNKYVSLGGIVLAPISINILLFHLSLDITGIAFGGVIFLLNIYIIYISWDDYASLFGITAANSITG